jgi:hypothetical protein
VNDAALGLLASSAPNKMIAGGESASRPHLRQRPRLRAANPAQPLRPAE